MYYDCYSSSRAIERERGRELSSSPLSPVTTLERPSRLPTLAPNILSPDSFPWIERSFALCASEALRTARAHAR